MFSCRVLFQPRGRTLGERWKTSHDCRLSRGLQQLSSTVSEIPRFAENRDSFTQGGRDRLARLMQHNIGLNRELKRARNLSWHDMVVEMAPRHTMQWSDLNYFTTQGLTYAEAVCRRYIADNVKPLWWRTQALGASTRPVIRNKATARMNAAFRQALHDAGYDTLGKRLPNQQDGHRSGDKAITHLFGTVVIKSHSPIEVHKLPFKELQDYCKKIVKAVEKTLGQRAGDPGRGTQAGPRQPDLERSGGGSRRGGRSS